MVADPKVLKYLGPGHWPGIPAQDLRASDVAQLPPDGNGEPWTAARLVVSGHYARIETSPRAQKAARTVTARTRRAAQAARPTRAPSPPPPVVEPAAPPPGDAPTEHKEG